MQEIKMNGESLNIEQENIAKLKEIFPEVFNEDKIDFEKLQIVLGNYIDTDEEKYRFTWNGKMDALRLSQTPSTGTLRPCKEESRDWDTTQNLYIEGDNLEVLKLLQNSYLNKIKMIYIDPPYNTGNDFVYKDDFKDNITNYKKMTGQIDSEGNSTSTNKETDGRYHTNWLNMMYPRLRLARNLLTDDGVIFISIDDNEVTNLRKLCDEVFGEENFIGTIVQNKQNSKNDTVNIQKNHEYIITYRKTTLLDDNGTKVLPTISGILVQTRDVYEENGEYFYINDAITTRGDGGVLSARPNLGYTVYYNPQTNDKIAICDYDISKAKIAVSIEELYTDNTELIERGYVPIRPPKVRGQLGVWTWSLEKFNDNCKNIIITGKAGNYAVKKRTFVDKSSVKNIDGKLCCISYSDSNVRSIWDFSTNEGTKTLNEVMTNSNIFNNAKNLEMIMSLIKLVNDKEFIALDFFSGSATTAHAVMQLNAEDVGNRKFICVQLPEITDEKSEAFQAGYKNICEIGKERIRRAGDKIKKEIEQENQQLKLGEEPKKLPDIGFKVFKLDSSNIRKWNPDTKDLERTLLDQVDNFVEGRKEEDALYEIILKNGLPLTVPVEELNVKGKKVYSIGMGAMIVCLDNNITLDVADEIAKISTEFEDKSMVTVVFKDNGFENDSVKTNIKETLRGYGIGKFVTV